MSRERVETILGGYDAFNRGDLDAAVEPFSEDIELVVLDMFPDLGPYTGREGVRRFWDSWEEAFAAFRIEVLEIHDLDEHVVAITRGHGTGRDSVAKVATPVFPTVWTWRDDEIVRMEMFPDEDTARAAIGKDWRS